MGTVLRNLFLSVSFAIFFALKSNAASQQQKRPGPPFVTLVGAVYCDACFQQELSTFSHFIPGASVAVKCDGGGINKLGFWKEAKTNRRGVFKLRLPAKVVSRNGKEIKSCSVRLVRSKQPFCPVASPATSADLQLKSIRNKVGVFSAGFLAFKPMKQADFCSDNGKSSASAKYKLADQKKRRMQSELLLMPPIPLLPSPPNIGGIPLPPNPFQPPPSILPPLPFQPSPPPFISIPPLPFQPSPPPFIGIPPLPFQPSPPPFIGIPPLPNIPPLPSVPPLPTLAPPPPPPPASIFPPLPFPPIFPGNPPAAPAQRNTP